jgi:hypothetical protein
MSEIVDDKTTMRRLGTAILAMCIGAITLMAIAILVGH